MEVDPDWTSIDLNFLGKGWIGRIGQLKEKGSGIFFSSIICNNKKDLPNGLYPILRIGTKTQIIIYFIITIKVQMTQIY